MKRIYAIAADCTLFLLNDLQSVCQYLLAAPGVISRI
jgi:hypothetical protein